VGGAPSLRALERFEHSLRYQFAPIASAVVDATSEIMIRLKDVPRATGASGSDASARERLD